TLEHLVKQVALWLIHRYHCEAALTVVGNFHESTGSFEQALRLNWISASTVYAVVDIVEVHAHFAGLLIRAREYDQLIVVELRIGERDQAAVLRAIMPAQVPRRSPCLECQIEDRLGIEVERTVAVHRVTIEQRRESRS